MAHKHPVALVFAFALLVGAAFAGSAPGQTPDEFRDFEDLSLGSILNVKVVTAARHEQDMGSAPTSVTVITAAEIADHGYETVAEAVQGLAGIQVSSDRNYDYLGVRGFAAPGDYNTRVLILLDGHPLNEPVWASAGTGNDGPVDLDMVDRIEVVRGPGSALYGTHAVFGIVNIITRRPGDERVVAAKGSVGSFDRREGAVRINRPFGAESGFVAGFSFLDHAGSRLRFPDFAQDGSAGWTDGTDGDRAARVNAALESGGFRAAAFYMARTKHIPTAPWETIFDDDATRTTDRRGFAEATFDHPLRDDLDLTLRTYADLYDYEGTWAYMDAIGSGDEETRILGGDSARSLGAGAEGRATWSPVARHRLTGGAELRRTRYEMRNVNEDPLGDYRDVSTDLAGWFNFGSLFVQEEYTPVDRVTATLGAHYDYYTHPGGILTPRLALVTEPLPMTYVKVLYGEGFKVPSLGELYFNDGDTEIENTRLDPERHRSGELIVERTWGTRAWTRLAGYYGEVHDLIALVEREGDGLLQYQNTGQADLQGMELEARASLARGIEARGSVAYQNARYGDGGRAVNSPHWLAAAGVRGQFMRDALTAGLETRFVGARRGVHEGSRLGEYLVADANVSLRLPVHGWRVALRVVNLGDASYADPGGEEHLMAAIPRDGRTWQVSLVRSGTE